MITLRTQRRHFHVNSWPLIKYKVIRRNISEKHRDIGKNLWIPQTSTDFHEQKGVYFYIRSRISWKENWQEAFSIHATKFPGGFLVKERKPLPLHWATLKHNKHCDCRLSASRQLARCHSEFAFPLYDWEPNCIICRRRQLVIDSTTLKQPRSSILFLIPAHEAVKRKALASFARSRVRFGFWIWQSK